MRKGVDLTDPVDIFAEWVDAIDAQARQREARRQRIAATEAEETAKKEDDATQGHSSPEGEEPERVTFNEVSD